MLRCARLPTSGIRHVLQRRWIVSYYELFPGTFPDSQPRWDVDLGKLRKEYRKLQAEVHPDKIQKEQEADSEQSSLLNKAYHALKDPLTRSQHMIQILKDVDLTVDSVAREYTQMDPELLMDVMDVHEQLLDANSRDEVKEIEKVNKQRIEKIEAELKECYDNKEYERAINLTARLKYWKNVALAVKDWAPGKPIDLKH
ncbi:related to J-type co-chaperone JAC1, mitochondrial [Nakaseomyces glabratus]|nr:DnaJ domain [Nakaseomyces glabratus]KAJ9569069.1 molecular chaperone [Nakaseomyces glabratus]QNG12115.1 uncharacterized protein GWK60_A00187 [Nakaseomyces glabratus]SCV16658.1 related to J-type co-chaperone JAC1, mitochondrial [Nakaseomyces glabratus]SLM16456.1 related to J-type co-chaperone JAC1, mitochondrial [Nakaseomyces glabratus]